MTHLAEEQLIAYALGDADEQTRQAVDAHAAECETCRAEIDALRATLEAAAESVVPERGDTYGAAVWARLEPQLPSAPSRVRATMNWRGWLAAAAVLLAVVGAFLAGRFSRETTVPQHVARATNTASDRRAIRERVVLAALGDHLDRTERALVELVNTDANGTVDISAEQAWARDLLDANRLYRQSVRGAGTPAIASLLDDLEPVLLDIVHSPSTLSADELHVLRARIEDRSLVFKLRVTGADVRARQRTLIHPGEKTS
jgi:putative zinc finger protein